MLLPNQKTKTLRVVAFINNWWISIHLFLCFQFEHIKTKWKWKYCQNFFYLEEVASIKGKCDQVQRKQLQQIKGDDDVQKS